MNETIGVKGGHNDYRRSLKIKEMQKKKILDEAEENEIKDLEKIVKKQQRYVLIKTLPIVIVGQTFKTLYDTATDKREKDIEEANSKWKIKEYGLDHTTESLQEKKAREAASKRRKDGTREVVIVDEVGRKIKVTIPEEKKASILDEVNIFKSPIKKEDEKKENKQLKENIEEKKIEEAKKVEEKVVSKDSQSYVEEPKKKKGIGTDSNDISYDIPLVSVPSEIDETSLTKSEKETLDKLKARKIVDEYEKQLKDIRYDLRKLIFEYNVLVDEADRAIVSEEMDVVLERLSDVISKVDELKRKIAIEDLDKYDDNYIYTLVEGYLEEFKDKRLVAEIKDSPLYVLISEKLDELDKKKDGLSKEVDLKKEALEEREEKFDILKEKYINIDRINKELLAFQNEQDLLLREIREKVRNATSVEEKVEVQVQAMNRQSKRLFRLLALSMLFPGARSAKSMASSAAAYLYFMNNILKPKTTTRKYKVITVKDYSKEIEKSLSAIDDATDLLGKTGNQIDKMISQINRDFADYFGVIKEADELMYNLKKIREEVREKEYEMEKIKEEQRIMLEKNNAKVKKMGTFEM